MFENEENTDKEKEGKKRFEALGFLPQKEIIYNRLLPYNSEIDKESNEALASIKLNLPKAVLAKELRPSVVHWTKQLTRYIRLYGLKFSKEDHILFIKLYLELLAIPEVEGSLIELILSILTKLLKKRHLLSRDDLVIQWRPLYDLSERLLSSKTEPMGLEWFPANIENSLKQVLRLCRIYYPASSTQEMLDQWRPLLCPFDITVGKGLRCLDWFLPTLVTTEDERNESWKLWFEELFAFWDSVHNGPTWEAMFINLFSRLALHNTGHIDWGPQCSKILTRLLRMFRLPVGKLKHTAKVSLQLQLDASSRWIVAMMGGPSSKTILEQIGNMFKAIKSYYYPSNYGKWTINLLNFLLSLTSKFVQRIHKERYKKDSWEPKTPESYRITDDEISIFVQTLTPVTFLGLYSKFSPSQACRVLQNLATLRPELILPELLEKSYVALETLTEPHQLRACLSALSFTLRVMMKESKWYPEGRTHVIPILFRVLPAIDSNDLPKSLMAFQFITTCFTLLPIVDCSEMIQSHPDLTEIERNLCLATAELPDFVVQFLDRVFFIIESLNQEHSSRSEESGIEVEDKLNPHDSLIVSAITSSVAVTMIQCSEEIFKRSLDKIFQFAATRLLNGNLASFAVSTLCRAVSKANPSAAAAKFLPHCCERIQELVEENPSILVEEKPDRQVLWNLSIVCEVSRCCDESLLLYKDKIFQVLDLCLKAEAKQIYSQASKLAREVVTTLTSYYERDSASYSLKGKENYLPIKDWGKCETPWTLQISWHEPSKEELEMAVEVVDLYLQPQLVVLEEYAEGEKEMTKEELLRTMTITYNILVGASQLLPNTREKEVEIKSQKNIVELQTWDVKTLAYHEHYSGIVEESGEMLIGLRRKIFETVRKALWKCMETRESDVKSVSKAIAIYIECLRFHELHKSEFEKHWTMFMSGKRAMQDALHGHKRHQRFLLTDRVILQHQLRSLTGNWTSYNEIFHFAMIDLLKLSMSHYSVVRIMAQRVFFRGIQLLPHKAHEHYLPLVTEALKLDPVKNHKQIKGALHLMHGPGGRNSTYLAYLHDWDVISVSWPALISASHSDRPSIVKLYDKLTSKIQTTYNTIPIEVQVNRASLEAARNILVSSSAPFVEEVVLEEVDTRLEAQNRENLDRHSKLVEDLMDLVDNGNLSWRHKHLASGFLMFLIRKDAPLSPRVVRHFTEGLIDEALVFRNLSIAVLGSILKKQERKRSVVMMSPEQIGGIPVQTGSIQPGNRPDNQWMQYDSTKLPKTAEEYDSAVFVEKTHWGYYQWPKELKTYKLHDENRKLDRTREEMQEHERVVFDKFSDPTFVEQLLKFLSLENVKGKDKYDTKREEMFKGLFRNFGDSILPVFQSGLERLAKDPQEASQRCVSEVVTGLVMGTKHWNFEKVNNLWSWLIPLLRITVDNISVETLKDWDQAYSHMVQNRDPRKIHWLLEFLIEEPVSGKGGSFMDATRLYLLGALHQQEWRVAQLFHRLLSQIEPKLDHQYKNVRDRMGSVLASIFNYDITILNKDHDRLSPKREELINRVFSRLTPLSKQGVSHIGLKTSEIELKVSGSRVQELSPPDMVEEEVVMPAAPTAAMVNLLEADVPEQMIQQMQERMQKMMSSDGEMSSQAKEMMLKFQQLLPPGVSMESLMDPSSRRHPRNEQAGTDLRDELESTSDDLGAPSSIRGEDNERNSAIRLLKTLMKFIISGQRSSLQPTTPHVLQLLPLICKMSPVDTQGSDEELHHDTQVSLSCLAQSYIPPHELDNVVALIKEISKNPSWHARHTILKFTQIFIFNNLFTLQESKQTVEDLANVILELIADEQLEVREIATTTLSGLLQCGLMVIDDRLNKFITDHCRVKVKGRKKQTTSQEMLEKQQKNLRMRHAGILALSACILSSPYSIPDHLPDLLMQLSDHLHDPQPIEATVKKTFSDFRRTHHDSWHQDKLKFTSDQLSILTDLLVSPCYYA